MPEGLPLRRPDLDDGVLPAGGTAAALAMLELGALAGDRRQYEIGQRAARVAAPRADHHPFRSGFLIVALDHLLGQSREVVIAGAADDPRTRALWAEVRSTSPARILPVRVGAAGADARLTRALPALSGKVALEGAPTAYVCEMGRCELPAHEPAELARQLRAAR